VRARTTHTHTHTHTHTPDHHHHHHYYHSHSISPCAHVHQAKVRVALFSSRRRLYPAVSPRRSLSTRLARVRPGFFAISRRARLWPCLPMAKPAGWHRQRAGAYFSWLPAPRATSSSRLRWQTVTLGPCRGSVVAVSMVLCYCKLAWSRSFVLAYFVFDCF
jgi:hypothetical protein